MANDTTTTRCAILGQLALRDWSAYELTRSMRRTVHWFWPRAESLVYAEAKRLEAEGLTVSRREPAEDGSRRTRTVYSITYAGRAVLAEWLATEPQTHSMQQEALLRVHLARFGTTEDLLGAIAWAEGVARQLLETADAVATEFVEQRHVLQDEAHIRGLLFDALAGQAMAMRDWAVRARREVEQWPSLAADAPARKRAIDRMGRHLHASRTAAPGRRRLD